MEPEVPWFKRRHKGITSGSAFLGLAAGQSLVSRWIK